MELVMLSCLLFEISPRVFQGYEYTGQDVVIHSGHN